MGAEDFPMLSAARRRLYDAVRQHPGIGARGAQRIARTAWGETVYHLGRLTAAGLLHRERTVHRDHYFHSDVPFADRALLGLARSDSARHLMLALLDQPGATVPELSLRTGLSAGRLSIHLRRLLARQWVRTGRSGRFRTFELTDPERVAHVLRTYRSTLADHWVDRALDTWSELFRV